MIYLTSSWENGTNVVNDKFILWREGTEYITAITDMADKIQNILHTTIKPQCQGWKSQGFCQSDKLFDRKSASFIRRQGF